MPPLCRNRKTKEAASQTPAKDVSQQEDTSNENEESSPPTVKYPGDDSTVPPGEDWEWRGPADKGSWYNPKTGESLHPDLDHPAPVGPHWDYNFKGSGSEGWRIYPDGSIVPKL